MVIITFRVSRRQCEMYIGQSHASACLSVCLSCSAFPHYCMDPDVTWKNGRGYPLVVQYWADLQSVHGFRCYGNIMPKVKCHRVLVLALCLVMIIIIVIKEALVKVKGSQKLMGTQKLTQVLGPKIYTFTTVCMEGQQRYLHDAC